MYVCAYMHRAYRQHVLLKANLTKLVEQPFLPLIQVEIPWTSFGSDYEYPNLSCICLPNKLALKQA